MFATLGFQVDTSGLVTFKKALSDARSEMTNITRGGKNATRQFRNLRREVDKLSSSMGKIKNAGGNRAVGGSYRNLAGDVWKVRNALDSIATNQPRTTKAIGKITASVIAGLTHWNAYRRSIVQTRRTLANLNGDLNRLRANARIDVRIRNQGGGGSGGSGGDGGLGGLGGLGFLGGAGIRGFLGAMLPTAALGSLGAAAGYGSVATVQASREQTKMENALLMTSNGAEDFADTLNFVRTEALRLGITSTELGRSFSQMNLSAKSMTKSEKKEMFTGFSEFMVALGVDKYGQKGILKAYNQMFALGKISQEEINQLSEHGIPATLVYDSAMKAHNLDSIKAVKDLQQTGGLIPELVLKELSKNMKALANDTGALAKMQQSSGFKQNVMKEQFEQTAKKIMDSGLDVQLGKVFEGLTGIIKDVESLARSLKFVVQQIGYLKRGLDGITGGNGGGILAALALLIFRFKAIRLGAHRAFIVLQAGGKITRALGELFKGVFGRVLKGIIVRFAGWVIVIYQVIKGLIYLGRQLEEKDKGNWTIFDTIAIASEAALWKVKLLIEQMKWLKAYLDAGLLTEEWEHSKKMMKDKAIDSVLSAEKILPFVRDLTPMGGATKAGKAIVDMMGIKDSVNVGDTPSLNNSSYYNRNQTPTKMTFNFFDEKGNLRRTEEHELPATFPR